MAHDEAPCPPHHLDSNPLTVLARRELVRRSVGVGRVQYHRAAPYALHVFEHPGRAFEIEPPAVAVMVMGEHQGPVMAQLRHADARRSVVEPGREYRFAHAVEVARGDFYL